MNTKNVDPFPIYSWTKGLFNYRIERNYPSGNKEIICRILKFKAGAEQMVITMVKALDKNKDKIDSNIVFHLNDY